MIQFFTSNFRRIFFASFIIFITGILQTRAQKSYFITNSNDTVKFTDLSGVLFKPIVKYKLHDGDTTHSIPISGIKEIGVANQIHANIWVPSSQKRLLIKLFMRGKINVYVRVTQQAYVDDVQYYAGKSDDTVAYEIKTNGVFGSRTERKNAFTSLIADAPEITEKFMADSSYTVKNLLTTLRNYNLYHTVGDVFFANKNNDTTRCKIIFDKDDGLLYKTPSVVGFKSLKTDSLNAYVIGRSIYFRHTLPERDGPQFITQIIKGKLNTYADLEGNLYITKPGVEYVKVKGKKDSPKHKNTFFYLIADKPEVVTKYKSKSYNDENLIKMILEYNGIKS